MKKSMLNTVKSLLLGSALALTIAGAADARSYAWELQCEGEADYCGTVTDYNLGVEVSVYGWAFKSFTYVSWAD